MRPNQFHSGSRANPSPKSCGPVPAARGPHRPGPHAADPSATETSAAGCPPNVRSRLVGDRLSGALQSIAQVRNVHQLAHEQGTGVRAHALINSLDVHRAAKFEGSKAQLRFARCNKLQNDNKVLFLYIVRCRTGKEGGLRAPLRQQSGRTLSGRMLSGRTPRYCAGYRQFITPAASRASGAPTPNTCCAGAKSEIPRAWARPLDPVPDDAPCPSSSLGSGPNLGRSVFPL